MARRKPRVSNAGSNEQTPDGGGDDSRRSGGFDPLLGWTAVGGAALATGFIAGKQTGVNARIVNKVKGETVGVHGSPVSGLKKIDPVLSPYAIREGYTTPEVYAANPVVGRSLSSATDYARSSGQGVKPQAGGGSVYIVKGKVSLTKEQLKDYPVLVSDKSFKVLKEFPLKEDMSSFYKDLKRYGAKLPKKR